jgi:hypothetical protein
MTVATAYRAHLVRSRARALDFEILRFLTARAAPHVDDRLAPV